MRSRRTEPAPRCAAESHREGRSVRAEPPRRTPRSRPRVARTRRSRDHVRARALGRHARGLDRDRLAVQAPPPSRARIGPPTRACRFGDGSRRRKRSPRRLARGGQASRRASRSTCARVRRTAPPLQMNWSAYGSISSYSIAAASHRVRLRGRVRVNGQPDQAILVAAEVFEALCGGARKYLRGFGAAVDERSTCRRAPPPRPARPGSGSPSPRPGRSPPRPCPGSGGFGRSWLRRSSRRRVDLPPVRVGTPVRPGARWPPIRRACTSARRRRSPRSIAASAAASARRSPEPARAPRRPARNRRARSPRSAPGSWQRNSTCRSCTCGTIALSSRTCSDRLGERVRRPGGVDGAFERRRERPRIGRLAGERNRLVAQRTAPGVVRCERQLLGQQRQQPRVAGRLRRVVELERPLDGRDPLRVDRTESAHEAAIVRQRRTGGEVCVRQLRGDPGRLQQRLAVRRYARLPLRLAEPDQRLAPGSASPPGRASPGRRRTALRPRSARGCRARAARPAASSRPPWLVDRHGRQPPVQGQLRQMLARSRCRTAARAPRRPAGAAARGASLPAPRTACD